MDQRPPPRQWHLCGETGKVTRILRQLQTIRLGTIHLKNEGLQVLKHITKVPADLNAQLATLKLLHLFAPPTRLGENRRDNTAAARKKLLRLCLSASPVGKKGI